MTAASAFGVKGAHTTAFGGSIGVFNKARLIERIVMNCYLNVRHLRDVKTITY